MKKRTREIAAPDITPLIDVVFLLLIFFMVSTVFKKDEMALLLNLPKTANGQAAQQSLKNVQLELSPSEVAINGKKSTILELGSFLKTLKDKTTAIELRVDKNVKYDRLMNLLDQLKKYELTNLNLISEN